jgi:integrase
MDMPISVWVNGGASLPYFHLQWRDPVTRKLRTKTTGIRRTDRKSDRRKAEAMARELEQRLNAGEAAVPSKCRWDDFRRRYEAEYLPGLAQRTREKIASVLDRLERELRLDRLWDLEERRLSAYVARLRAGDERAGEPPLAESTIHGHMSHLKSALNWAKSQKLIPRLPAFPRITRAKLSKGNKLMRGRPITLEECERMITAAQDELGHEAAPDWVFYMKGLWASGLRLTESLELYWDRSDKLHPVFTGRFPMLRIPAELEKGHKDRLLPMAPEFARLLLAVPEDRRIGPVFPLRRRDGKPGRLSPERVSKIISRIGARANVCVATNKTASAHDFRRAFGERWSARLMPTQLMELMRHESMDTTLKYYVGRNAERTASILWSEDRKAMASASPTASGAAAECFGIDEDGVPHSL